MKRIMCYNTIVSESIDNLASSIKDAKYMIDLVSIFSNYSDRVLQNEFVCKIGMEDKEKEVMYFSPTLKLSNKVITIYIVINDGKLRIEPIESKYENEMYSLIKPMLDEFRVRNKKVLFSNPLFSTKYRLY